MGEKRSVDTNDLEQNAKTRKLETNLSDDETRSNRETTSLLWYDAGIEEASTSFKDDIEVTRKVLRELNDFVQLFSKEAACIDYMEKNKAETILLIVSGSGASTSLLDRVHALRHVDAVLIFCITVSKYQTLLDPSLKYWKIVGIFDEQQSLKESIVRTVCAIEKQAAIFSIYSPEKQKSNHNLSQESGSFLWFQLMKITIQKMRADNDQKSEDTTAKEDMLSRCRLYYRGNMTAITQIDEFERTYTPSEAISWYTRDSFIYRLINKALRTEDVAALYDYRFYIADLCRCLAENFDILLNFAPSTTFKLYRGVKQSRTELQRLQDGVGQLISMNTFLSTSRNRSIAEVYAGVGSKSLVPSDLESVIFEITVDISTDSTCVADVSFYSPFRDEEEILFDFAAVFEIEMVTFDSASSSWICKLVTTDKGKATAKEYMELQLHEIDKEDAAMFFGTILLQMGKYKKAKEFFSNLKDRKSTNNPDLIHRLGYSYYGLDEYQNALEHFGRARSMYLNEEPPDFEKAAKVATHMGNAHTFLCQYSEALICQIESLNLYGKAGMIEQLPVVRTLVGLGEVYNYMGKNEASLQCCQQALNIAQRLVPFDHPSLGSAYMYVAEALYRLGDYDQALNHIKKTINIERSVHPGKSGHIGGTLIRMGKYLYKKGNYDEALTLSIEASELFAYESVNKCSISYAGACNNIGKIYFRQEHYEKAKEFYDKALTCLKSLMPNGHVDIAYTLKNQSELYLVYGDLDAAVLYSHNAREYY